VERGKVIWHEERIQGILLWAKKMGKQSERGQSVRSRKKEFGGGLNDRGGRKEVGRTFSRFILSSGVIYKRLNLKFLNWHEGEKRDSVNIKTLEKATKGVKKHGWGRTKLSGRKEGETGDNNSRTTHSASEMRKGVRLR